MDRPFYENVPLFSSSAYRCPLCMHSVWNMEEHWEQMDQEIAQSPMPPEYQGATVKVRPQEDNETFFNVFKSKAEH